MMKNYLHVLTVWLLLVIALSLCSLARSFYVEGDFANPYVFVSPPVHVAKETGELFDMAINVCDVNNLHSFEFKLSYNTSLLDVTQAVQGPFLPPPPQSSVTIETNESAGFVWMNVSVVDSEPGRSGDGILARITFTVTLGAACSQSLLDLQDTSLCDDSNTPISHDSIDGLYFWKSAQPDPPPPGRLLDLCTQKGGVGPDEPGGAFLAGEIVELLSRVTYNDWPVQNILVLFQVIEPLGSTVVVQADATDENGWANISFRIATLPESYGLWTAVSVAAIADETVWDTLNFLCVSELPYGPTAIFTNPSKGVVNQTVPFDASDSLPGWNGTHEMPITEYRWDFNGDGYIDFITTDETATYSYSASGIYYPQLTVYAPGATPETDTAVGNILIFVPPVGGYSRSVSATPPLHLWECYWILVVVMTSIVVFIRRKINMCMVNSKREVKRK